MLKFMSNTEYVISTKRTHNHHKIQEWVESRGGTPSVAESSWDGHSGVLQIDFGESEEALAELSWDDFFRIFEENDLDFLYQEESESRFWKCVSRE